MSNVSNFLDELENKQTPETQFEAWLQKVNKERKEYWDNNLNYKEYEPLTYEKGRKYIKVLAKNGSSVWAFVSMVTGSVKGSPVKKGDLLKPASFNSPAKHSRGNIFEGTDRWGFYGVEYLN